MTQKCFDLSNSECQLMEVVWEFSAIESMIQARLQITLDYLNHSSRIRKLISWILHSPFLMWLLNFTSLSYLILLDLFWLSNTKFLKFRIYLSSYPKTLFYPQSQIKPYKQKKTPISTLIPERWCHISWQQSFYRFSYSGSSRFTAGSLPKTPNWWRK
jgi:hypothetical protein